MVAAGNDTNVYKRGFFIQRCKSGHFIHTKKHTQAHKPCSLLQIWPPSLYVWVAACQSFLNDYSTRQRRPTHKCSDSHHHQNVLLPQISIGSPWNRSPHCTLLSGSYSIQYIYSSKKMYSSKQMSSSLGKTNALNGTAQPIIQKTLKLHPHCHTSPIGLSQYLQDGQKSEPEAKVNHFQVPSAWLIGYIVFHLRVIEAQERIQAARRSFISESYCASVEKRASL